MNSKREIRLLHQRLQTALRENRRFRERIELLASQNYHLRERYKEIGESTPEVRVFDQIQSSVDRGTDSRLEPSRASNGLCFDEKTMRVFPVFENGIRPLDPSPGLRCMTSHRAKIRVGFQLFGLNESGIEQAASKIEERQLRDRDFIPVFVTDNDDFSVFRSRGYVFEYIPPSIANASTKQRTKRRILKDRLELIKAKWKLHEIVDLSG